MRTAARGRAVAVLAIVLASGSAPLASGCGSAYKPAEETAADASVDAAVLVDGPAVSPDGGTTDASACGADLKTDPKNCGRCGHDCLGGACQAGACLAVQLASLGGAPLTDVVLAPPYVFASTIVAFSTEIGGIWRVPAAGGAAEMFVGLRDVIDMRALGATLYFVVNDSAAGGASGGIGGLYSCPVAAAAPCVPTLVAAAETPRALTVDMGRVLYTDAASGKGLMAYVPPGAPTLFRSNLGSSNDVFVDGTTVFHSAAFFGPPKAKLFEDFSDDTFVERYVYVNQFAVAGDLLGYKNAIFFAAFDAKNTAGGVVRRIPRGTGAGQECDLGGTTNKRPYGIHADDARVYWTNQGAPDLAPVAAGSLVSCAQGDCCATPTVHWIGDGVPRGVTGDAAALYFVTRASSLVYKLAKP